MFTARSATFAHPLSRAAARAAMIASGALGAVALFAGAVRIVPWLLDPKVPARVAVPFARGVVELAVEAAILVGWPLGFALASQKFAERGEARALMLLGESPIRSAFSQWRSALPLAGALALASALGALDATAPGRMAQDLIAQGRAACASTSSTKTVGIPFVSAVWLCAPGMQPRLYGWGPGALHGVSFTASDARVSGDMRRIDLDDARFSLSASDTAVDVRAKRVALHGMSPWTHASNVGPLLRALIVVLSAALASLASVHATITRRARGTFAAVLVGVSGPLAALGLMRALDRAGAPTAAYLATPIASLMLPLALGALLGLLAMRRPDC
jgi:hypothetical protein